MRYYLIAGEASGDLHGSNLVKALLNANPTAEIRCWGGDKMAEAGATVVKHYRDLAFMGFIEVIKHLPEIMRNIAWCKQDIEAYKPDVLVLIDYPGFNMRIAAWAKNEHYKTVYYISPQVWAWKESRVEKLKRDIDLMLVILPFEKAFYQKHAFEVTYVGHPLTEVIAHEIADYPVKPVSAKPVIALLPGSRAQEIKLKLPIMLGVVPHFPGYDFVVAQAPSQPDSLYEQLITGTGVKLERGGTYNLLKQAKAALVTSGTATLETALFGVPQVVCYKGNALSFWLAKQLVKVKYISLVNLIMDKPVVKELIQDDLTTPNLVSALKDIIENKAAIKATEQSYRELRSLLGETDASLNAATAIAHFMNNGKELLG